MTDFAYADLDTKTLLRVVDRSRPDVKALAKRLEQYQELDADLAAIGRKLGASKEAHRMERPHRVY